MRVSNQPDPPRPAPQFQRRLTPFFVFALVAAIACWVAAWAFRDTYELLVVLVSVGCLLLVAAICAYLFLLVSSVERDG